MKTNQRGQGTIEYLVIIAIVVVIALVVVGLLLQVMNQGSGVPETSAKAAWKSTEPFAIVDWAGSSSDHKVILILQNTSAETREFNSICLNGASDCNTAVAQAVPSGAKVNVRVTIASSCSTSGAKFVYSKDSILIDYNTMSIDNLKERGVADIVGTCS